MMNGGNILVLRDILGHADISMTIRNAHFAPDHLSEAITHNPTTNLQPILPKNIFLLPLGDFQTKKEPQTAALYLFRCISEKLILYRIRCFLALVRG